jgi:hypothetical protein
MQQIMGESISGYIGKEAFEFMSIVFRLKCFVLTMESREMTLLSVIPLVRHIQKEMRTVGGVLQTDSRRGLFTQFMVPFLARIDIDSYFGTVTVHTLPTIRRVEFRDQEIRFSTQNLTIPALEYSLPRSIPADITRKWPLQAYEDFRKLLASCRHAKKRRRRANAKKRKKRKKRNKASWSAANPRAIVRGYSSSG